MTSFGSNLKSKRIEHGTRLGGEFSQTDLRDALIAIGIPRRYVPSVPTLSRWETGKVNAKGVDAIIVVGIANVFGCSLSDLSEEVADELQMMRDLLEHALPCTTARQLTSAR